jgi:hypothetical protein
MAVDAHPLVAAGTLLMVAGNVTVGTAGAIAVGSTLPEKGDAVGVGTGAAELTPRLVISVESSGMPTGLLPELVDEDVDIGVEDELTLVEPEPHIPDIPDVSMIPDAVAIPELCSMPDVVDRAEVAEREAEPGVPVAVVPDMAPVAGVAGVIPPPS